MILKMLVNNKERRNEMSKKAKKHTLNQYRIDEKICLEKAYAKGKEKGLKDDELFNFVEKESLEQWENRAI
jgi:hypothetical protein